MTDTTNTMTHKFLKDGAWIEVSPETWRWEATYEDGSILKQFGDDGIFHQFQEIDQKKLAQFRMVSDNTPPYTLMFNPKKMKLIHYYKRFCLNMGAENEVKFTVYCFGFETKIFGRTAKTNVMLLPSGETILTEDTNLVNFQ